MDLDSLRVKMNAKKKKAISFVKEHRVEIIGGAITFVSAVAVTAIAVARNSAYSDDHEEVSQDIRANLLSDSDMVKSEAMINDKPERKRFIRDIDVTNTRLKDNEKQFLEVYSEQSDRFRDKEQTEYSRSDGWCSDGRYTRDTETKYSFDDDTKGFVITESYCDDDGQTGSYTQKIQNGRDIINFVKENRNSEMFDDVQDILEFLD